jgi:hypothetical protein
VLTRASERDRLAVIERHVEQRGVFGCDRVHAREGYRGIRFCV